MRLRQQPNSSIAAPDVLFVCYRLQMCRVDTTPDATFVVEDQPHRHGTDKAFIGIDVRLHRFAACAKASIPIVETASP